MSDEALLFSELKPHIVLRGGRIRGHGLRANKNSAEFCVTRLPKNGQIPDDVRRQTFRSKLLTKTI